MQRLRSAKSPIASDEVYALACGPDRRVNRYSGCVVNGIRFHAKEREKNLRTQNSGVIVIGEHHSQEIEFYGVLQDIIELKYIDNKSVFLFKCDWWNVGNKKTGISVDQHFTSVNISKTWYEDDQFVLANQVSQCFYVSDTKLRGAWQVVQRVDPRNIYDVLEKNEEVDMLHDVFQHEEQIVVNEIQDEDVTLTKLDREDVPSDEIEATKVRQIMEIHQENELTLVDKDLEGEDDTLINYVSEGEDLVSSDWESDLDE